MSTAGRFRLFGRPGSAAASSAAARPGPPPPRPVGPAPIGAGAPWPDAGPATRAARPVAPRTPVVEEPPTDPYGFPPVPAAPARTPDPAEAGALAAAFAVDYLSWDEDDPARRGRVLLDHLPAVGGDRARLGWSGRGRQRADFALPGLVRPDGDGRVLVDVRVRITPYRSVGEHDRGSAEPLPGCTPAAAPAPTARGWRSLAACWVRLSVPVTHDGGRLVVDAWEETLGELGPVVPAPALEDPSLADDDPPAGTQR